MANVSGFSSGPQRVINATLDPSSIPANGANVETFTVNGLDTTMNVVVDAKALEAGVALIGASVSAANTLKLTFMNLTAAAIDPASQVFNIIAL